MKESEEEIKRLKVAISGGDLSDKPGVLQNQANMLKAIYDPTEGVVPRLTNMERRELARMSWIKGAWFVTGGIGGLLGWLLHGFIK